MLCGKRKSVSFFDPDEVIALVSNGEGGGEITNFADFYR